MLISGIIDPVMNILTLMNYTIPDWHIVRYIWVKPKGAGNKQNPRFLKYKLLKTEQSESTYHCSKGINIIPVKFVVVASLRK